MYKYYMTWSKSHNILITERDFNAHVMINVPLMSRDEYGPINACYILHWHITTFMILFLFFFYFWYTTLYFIGKETSNHGKTYYKASAIYYPSIFYHALKKYIISSRRSKTKKKWTGIETNIDSTTFIKYTVLKNSYC